MNEHRTENQKLDAEATRWWERYEAIQRENERLRAALERIARTEWADDPEEHDTNTICGGVARAIAREALRPADSEK